MKIIGQRSLAAAFALATMLGASSVAYAQQQAPDTQNQQNAPAQPGASMGRETMKEGMDHGRMGQPMGRKGMEGEHGHMGSGMKQGGSGQPHTAGATTGSNPSTAQPPTGSK